MVCWESGLWCLMASLRRPCLPYLYFGAGESMARFSLRLTDWTGHFHLPISHEERRASVGGVYYRQVSASDASLARFPTEFRGRRGWTPNLLQCETEKTCSLCLGRAEMRR